VPGDVTAPRTDTDGSPACGYVETADPGDPAAMYVRKRITDPPAQRSPSPNTDPVPPPVCVVPWKNNVLDMGKPSAVNNTVWLARLSPPDARTPAPTPSELRQPTWAATGLLLPHGHPTCGA